MGFKEIQIVTGVTAEALTDAVLECQGYRDEADADVVLTNADVVTTNADVVITNADVVSTNADVVTTNADVVLTNADVVTTNANVVTTNAAKIEWKGDYVAGAYLSRDAVALNFSSYIANKDTSETPSDTAVDWDILTGAGDADSLLLDAFFNGATVTNLQGNITSDGITVTASVEALGGGDIKYKTSTGFVILDCTPAQTVVLTHGTDTNPNKNYIYIDVSTGLMTHNITGFPATEYVPLATSIVPSAAHVQTDGTYATHKWSDHVFTEGDNGHLTHLNEWLRNQHATWIDGVAPSFTGSGTTTVEMSLASGNMFQLHKHATEAIASPASIHVYNDFASPYKMITNLVDIDSDSAGNLFGNGYFALVVWYAYSELTGDSKIMINLPSDAYSSEADARQDSGKHTNFSIDTDFKGTAILLHRLICRNTGSLTIFDGAGDDLRGTLPNTASGSSTSVGSTFLDSTFRIENTTDTTKQIAVDASAITTATTRTITMPDRDVSLDTYTQTEIDASELLRVPKTGVQDTDNWLGEAYVDPDAVGANPTAKIYPNGTIIGSTDNGGYIKYPNGEFEAIMSGTVVASSAFSNFFGTTSGTTYRGGVSFLFPLTVIDTNTKFSFQTNAIRIEPTTTNTTSISAFAYYYNNTDTTTTTVTSRGRWK